MPSTSPVLAMRRVVLVLLSLALVVPAGLLAPTTSFAAAAASLPKVIDGPDVASYQHPYGKRIAWGKVRRSGKEFAIIKATEGTTYRNPWFHRDYAGAHRAGLTRGSYHFARPKYPIVRSARAQARYYANRLGTSLLHRKTLPPALDLEVTGGLGRAALVTWAQTFLLELHRRTHRTPMIYTYPYFWSSAMGDPAAFARYRLWMASYSSRPSVPHALWQYTSTAHVKGIAGGVDMSRFVGDPESWRLLADGRLPQGWTTGVPGPPQSVSVTYHDGDAVVRWLPGGTGSTDIRSYVVTLGGGQSVTVGPTTFAATLHGLERGQTYDISISARNAVGRGTVRHVSFLAPLRRAVLEVPRPDVIVYGADGLARVRLTKASGGALSGRHITVAQRTVGTEAFQQLPDIVTNDRGWAVLKLVQPTASQDLVFRFAGGTRWQPVQAATTLWVRSAVTATLSATSAVVGQPMTLTGTVGPALSGLTVRRQELIDGVWQTVETGVTLPGGTFSFAFAPEMTGKHLYRAVVPRFPGYATGYSAPLTLAVAGLPTP